MSNIATPSERQAIYSAFFSNLNNIDFDSLSETRISQIRWSEFRMGYRRFILVKRRKVNRDLFSSNVHSNSLRNLKGEKYSGFLTDSAALGIKRAFEKMLVYSVPFMAKDYDTGKKRLCTMVSWLFTVPAGYGPLVGKTMNQLMTTVLNNLRKKYPIHMYLGKQEFTVENMPHVHLDVNVYMSYYYVHRAWCTVLKDQPCYQSWLAAHPTHDPDNPRFDPEEKDNLVGYRPLWTASECNNYLYCYLKKMTQNKIPVTGKVWFQSTKLRDSKLPLLKLNYSQQKLLEDAKTKELLRSFNVTLDFYEIDADGVISKDCHHSNTLATLWRPMGKSNILDFLTPSNLYRFHLYRDSLLHGCVPDISHDIYFDRMVVYSKQKHIKNGDRVCLKSFPALPCPNIDRAHTVMDRVCPSKIYYTKTYFDHHENNSRTA